MPLSQLRNKAVFQPNKHAEIGLNLRFQISAYSLNSETPDILWFLFDFYSISTCLIQTLGPYHRGSQKKTRVQ